MKTKKNDARLMAIDSVLTIGTSGKDIEKHKLEEMLEATGMPEELVKSAIDDWEMDPKGLMWYHAREWMLRVRRDL